MTKLIFDFLVLKTFENHRSVIFRQFKCFFDFLGPMKFSFSAHLKLEIRVSLNYKVGNVINKDFCREEQNKFRKRNCFQQG